MAGVARLPYLPVLRAVKGPDEALEYKDVQSAAEKLRRTMEGKLTMPMETSSPRSMYLAADGDKKAGGLIPGAKPTKIPGLTGPVSEIFGYGLWMLILAGVGGAGYGVYKLAVADKSRNGGGASRSNGWAEGLRRSSCPAP